MSILEIREQLDSVSNKKHPDRLFWKCSIQFEEELLLKSDIPDEYFKFFIELLSLPKYFNQKGVVHFIIAIKTDSFKLTSKQSNFLLSVIVKYHDKYEKNLICHAIADFIVTVFNEKIVFKTLTKISQCSTNNSKYICVVAGNILMNKLSINDPLYKSVKELLKLLEK